MDWMPHALETAQWVHLNASLVFPSIGSSNFPVGLFVWHPHKSPPPLTNHADTTKGETNGVDFWEPLLGVENPSQEASSNTSKALSLDSLLPSPENWTTEIPDRCGHDRAKWLNFHFVNYNAQSNRHQSTTLSWSNLCMSFHFCRKSMKLLNRLCDWKTARQGLLHPLHILPNVALQWTSLTSFSRKVKQPGAFLRLLRLRFRTPTSFKSAPWLLESSVRSDTGSQVEEALRLTSRWTFCLGVRVNPFCSGLSPPSSSLDNAWMLGSDGIVCQKQKIETKNNSHLDRTLMATLCCSRWTYVESMAAKERIGSGNCQI